MKKKLIILFTLFILIFQLNFSVEEKFKVKVYSQKIEEGIYNVVVDNYAPFPQQVEIKFNKLENLKSSVDIPYYCEVEGDARAKKLFQVSVIKKAKFSYSLDYTFFIGSTYISSSQKNMKYILPFEQGKEYMLSQGNNGKFTHSGSSRFAFDFDMKEGSGVCAARDGIVAEIRDGSTVGGDNKRLIEEGNHIVIYHEDGTVAMYSHLQNKGIMVKLGEKVKAGQLIGLSGNTGYSSGPHLHFEVMRPIKLNYESVEIEFSDEKSNKINMKERNIYKRK